MVFFMVLGDAFSVLKLRNTLKISMLLILFNLKNLHMSRILCNFVVPK